MANECLVTRLLGTVNDDSLEKLGVLRIKFKINDASQKGLYVSLKPTCNMYTSSDVDLTRETSQNNWANWNPGANFLIDEDTNTFIRPRVVDSYITVDITKKYDSILAIGSNDSEIKKAIDQEIISGGEYLSSLQNYIAMDGSKTNIDIFKNSALIYLYIQNAAEIKGSLSSLAGHNMNCIYLIPSGDNDVAGSLTDVVAALSPSAGLLGITNSKLITGEMDDIKTLTSLTNLTLGGCPNISGAIEPFMVARRLSGNMSALNITLPKNVTVNGIPINSPAWVGTIENESGNIALIDSTRAAIAWYDGNWHYSS